MDERGLGDYRKEMPLWRLSLETGQIFLWKTLIKSRGIVIRTIWPVSELNLGCILVDIKA